MIDWDGNVTNNQVCRKDEKTDGIGCKPCESTLYQDLDYHRVESCKGVTECGNNEFLIPTVDDGIGKPKAACDACNLDMGKKLEGSDDISLIRT